MEVSNTEIFVSEQQLLSGISLGNRRKNGPRCLLLIICIGEIDEKESLSTSLVKLPYAAQLLGKICKCHILLPNGN